MSVATASCDCHMILQGVIYSETAVANYPDPDVFNCSLHIIPARRLGYPEEVAGHAMWIAPFLSLSTPLPSSPSLLPSLPRCQVWCASSSPRLLSTSLAVLSLWMVDREYTDCHGSSPVRGEWGRSDIGMNIKKLHEDYSKVTERGTNVDCNNMLV